MLELYCIADAWESSLQTEHGHGNSFRLFFGTVYSLSNFAVFVYASGLPNVGILAGYPFLFLTPIVLIF